MQGFLESGPQVTLQLSLLFRGYTSKSKQMLINPYLYASINESSHHLIGQEDYNDDYDYDDAIPAATTLQPILYEGSDFKGTTELPKGSMEMFGHIYDKGNPSRT